MTVELVALDIGGTNARFALVDATQVRPEPQHARSLPTADYASLQHAAEQYLGAVANADALPAVDECDEAVVHEQDRQRGQDPIRRRLGQCQIAPQVQRSPKAITRGTARPRHGQGITSAIVR